MKINVKYFACWLIVILANGLSSSALAQADLVALDRHFADARQSWDVPGMAVAIVKDGDIVLAKGYGVLETGNTENVNEHTLFAIASNTKAFISGALASLVDDGKMNWDDPVRKYLPYFELYDDYVSNETRVRDVLSHRVGLGTFSGDVIWYKSDFQPEEIIRRAAHLPPAYNFRAGYGYSNLMFITAGEIIRIVTGKPWDEHIREQFFEPLGMQRTVTSTSALREMENVATPHKIVDGKNQAISWVNWDNMGAAGGIISSVRDMAQWIKLQLAGGIVDRDTLFSPSSQTVMWQPHNSYAVPRSMRLTYPGRNFAGYGLGWSTSEYRGLFVANHGGGYDGMFSHVAVIPDQNLGVVVLTNTMKGISPWLINDVIDAYLGDPVRDWSVFGLDIYKRARDRFDKRIEDQRATRIPGTSPNFSFGDYSGTYRSDFYGEVEVLVDDGKLRLIFPRAPGLNTTLTHWHYDTYEINWDQVHAWFSFGTVQFTSDHRAEISGMTFSVPNDDIFFEEILLRKIE